MRDDRLIGVWKSDARRTMKSWVFRPGTPLRRRKAIAGIFGKLVVKYTPSRVISEYEGHRESGNYKVLGKDQNSVAVFWWGELGPKAGEIEHVHFDKNHFWVLLPGGNVEWFRRVRPETSNPRLQRAARSRRR
jgi:hypothetical protein